MITGSLISILVAGIGAGIYALFVEPRLIRKKAMKRAMEETDWTNETWT